jgi:aspartate/methionine/tyrosine aminotransferase
MTPFYDSDSPSVTLTELEVKGLRSACNLADGHAYHALQPPQQRIVDRLPELWGEATRARQHDQECAFRDAFIRLSGCHSLAGYRPFRILPTASNAIDTVGSWLALRGQRTGLVTPTFDNLALILKRRGVALQPVAESVLYGEGPAGLSDPQAIDALFWVNPNNPTGLPLNRALLRRWAEWCAANGKTMVFDNTFRFFLEPRFDLYRELLDSGVRFLSFEDTGKVWPTLDLKASLLFYSAGIAPEVERLYEEIYLGVSNFALVVLGAFLDDSAIRGLETTVWKQVGDRRACLRDCLAGGPLQVAPGSEGSRLSVEWVRIAEGHGHDRQWIDRLHAKGLMILPGGPFHWEDGGPSPFLRFSLLKPEPEFQAGLAILSEALQ